MVEASTFSSIAVIGGGAWGTALANLCASNGVNVLLWAREEDVVRSINKAGENAAFLSGIQLSQDLKATNQLADTADAEAYLMVAPAQHCREVLENLAGIAATDAPVALCSKGVERASGQMMTEVLTEVWPQARPAVLSGPSFARDVAQGLPTAVTLACADAGLGGRWMATIGAPHFRPYLTHDLIGAELGGAVKNVLAIAAGVVVGRGFGDSARAALIARGFAEFQRLGVALGADAQTMAGLSGLGDLILTASSLQSRNMSLGVELGKGRNLNDILGERTSVSEGVWSADAVTTLANNAGVEMPICEAVAALVGGRQTIDEIISALLARPFKPEAK